MYNFIVIDIGLNPRCYTALPQHCILSLGRSKTAIFGWDADWPQPLCKRLKNG